MKKTACSQPNLKQLITAYRFEILGADEAKRVELHISQCQACAEEFYALLPLTEAIKENAGDLLETLSQIKDQRRRSFFGWLYKFKRAPSIFKFASSSAALVLIASVWIYLTKAPWKPSLKPMGTTRSAGRSVETRSGINSAPDLLEWDAVPGASLYVTEIVDVKSGSVILRSETTVPALSLSNTVRDRFESGATYRLKIKAIDSSGNLLASISRELTIPSSSK